MKLLIAPTTKSEGMEKSSDQIRWAYRRSLTRSSFEDFSIASDIVVGAMRSFIDRSLRCSFVASLLLLLYRSIHSFFD